MNTEFTIEFRGNYIYVRHAEGFEISTESAEEFWRTLAEECRTYDCRRVLKECLPIKMDLLDAYKSATAAANSIPGLNLACCFENYSENDVTEFFKTAALNRGVRIEFFSDTGQALDWLGVG